MHPLECHRAVGKAKCRSRLRIVIEQRDPGANAGERLAAVRQRGLRGGEVRCQVGLGG